jgi:hypothetical protein
MNDGAQNEDCLGCRMVGGAVGIGGGGYVVYTGLRGIDAAAQRAVKLGRPFNVVTRKATVIALGGSLCFLGLYRAFMPANQSNEAID